LARSHIKLLNPNFSITQATSRLEISYIPSGIRFTDQR
jgi:hypothetical protein